MMFNGAGMTKRMRALLSDRQGNFAMMTALTLPLLMGFAGAGLELTKALQVKSDLQNAADSGTLAAATKFRETEGKLSDDQLKAEVKLFLGSADFAKELNPAQKQELDENVNSVASRFKTSKGDGFRIATTVSYKMPLNPLLSFIGAKTLTLSATSTSESSFNNGSPLSMYLVLDRSGSMSFKTDTIDKSKSSCQNFTVENWTSKPSTVKASSPCYVAKSTSLKTAVNYLVATLNTSDITYKASGSPESTFVRTGAIAYNDKSFAGQDIDWGTQKANAYVQAIPLVPEGGTNADAALITAFNALKSTNTKESDEHKKKGNLSFKRYIVLMTDGEMTGSSNSWNAAVDASVRATCAKAKADDIDIFTVAFMAPPKGKSLLQACATSADNYYAPENMEEIVAAFGDIARKASGNVSRLTN